MCEAVIDRDFGNILLPNTISYEKGIVAQRGAAKFAPTSHSQERSDSGMRNVGPVRNGEARTEGDRRVMSGALGLGEVEVCSSASIC